MSGEAIASLSDLIVQATTTPEFIPFTRGPRSGGAAATAPIAGKWTSLWRYDGQPGGATAIPTSSAVCTNTTVGGMQHTSPGAGAKKRALSVTVGSLVSGTLLLYDRLVHMAGLDGTSTSAQTVSTSALTRHTSGVGVEAAVEIYTQIGATATTGTVAYTDTLNASQTSGTFDIGATNRREQDRWLFVPVVSGGKGIKAISTLTLAASTTTAGNFGVTLMYRLAELPLSAVGIGEQYNFVTKRGGPPDLEGDACMALGFFPNGTTVPELFGSIAMTEK